MGELVVPEEVRGQRVGAGLEVLREADRYQQTSPELSREEAIYAVLRDNADLTHRYLRGSYRPGT